MDVHHIDVSHRGCDSVHVQVVQIHTEINFIKIRNSSRNELKLWVNTIQRLRIRKWNQILDISIANASKLRLHRHGVCHLYKGQNDRNCLQHIYIVLYLSIAVLLRFLRQHCLCVKWSLLEWYYVCVFLNLFFYFFVYFSPP